MNKAASHLGRDKRVLVTSRLAKRLRQLKLEGYGEYCDLLRSPAGEEELRYLIDRISTNHTHFFREIKHFDFLREKVLPDWRPNRRRKARHSASGARRVRPARSLIPSPFIWRNILRRRKPALADRGHGHFNPRAGNRAQRRLRGGPVVRHRARIGAPVFSKGHARMGGPVPREGRTCASACSFTI